MLSNFLPDDQWLAEWQRDLSPQDVEVSGGPRAVGHNHVGRGELLHGKLRPFVWREVSGVVIALIQEGLNASSSLLQNHGKASTLEQPEDIILEILVQQH